MKNYNFKREYKEYNNKQKSIMKKQNNLTKYQNSNLNKNNPVNK